jgi:serine protease DegS
MRKNRLLRFLVSYALVGMIVAAAIMVLFPSLLGQERPVVELLTTGASNPAAEDPRGLGHGPVSYAHAVERAAPAVVNIYTSKRVRQPQHPFADDPLFLHFFGPSAGGETRERMETSLGSGVIFSALGHVLTNNHVIQGADQIQVMLNDGRSATARLVGADPESDLAVLAIELDHVPAITLGRSAALRVGDVVLAIGNPYGVGQTVTQGIVSATGRNQLGLSSFENFIQTDAAINPGNSGGALINAHGELVGINTAIFSRSGGSHGIGFAIPTDLARDVLTSIIEHGRVVRGWAGVEVQPLTPPLAQSFGLDSTHGAIIAGVLREGPADRAGLRPGDVIRRLDGQPVSTAQALLGAISARKPGQKLLVEAWRDGETITTTLQVDERPERR